MWPNQNGPWPTPHFARKKPEFQFQNVASGHRHLHSTPFQNQQTLDIPPISSFSSPAIMDCFFPSFDFAKPRFQFHSPIIQLLNSHHFTLPPPLHLSSILYVFFLYIFLFFFSTSALQIRAFCFLLSLRSRWNWRWRSRFLPDLFGPPGFFYSLWLAQSFYFKTLNFIFFNSFGVWGFGIIVLVWWIQLCWERSYWEILWFFGYKEVRANQSQFPLGYAFHFSFNFNFPAWLLKSA